MSGTSMDGVDASVIKSNGKIVMKEFLINIMNMTVKYTKISLDLRNKYYYLKRSCQTF